jgi:plasmid stabilization system protein ParE
MKIVFADAARGDLRAIALHIADDNPPRAISFVQEIRDRCGSLSRHAERFPEATRIDGVLVRKITHANYLIFYAVAADTIEILRIIHSARDWVAVLEGRG